MKRTLSLLMSLMLLAFAVLVIPAAALADYTMVEVTKGASIRSTPGFNGEKLTLAQPGSKYLYLETEGKWYAIRMDSGATGYLPADSCKLVTTSTPPAGLIPEGADDSYMEGIALMAEGKYYSAQQAFLASSTADAAEMAEKCVQPLPATGELWHSSAYNSKQMEVEFILKQTDSSAGRVFMVYSEKGDLASILFVRGSGSVYTSLPGGHYRVRDGWGTNWYGTKEAFGREGCYELMVFKEFENDEYLTDLPSGYRWTISINATESGSGTSVGTDSVDWDAWSGGAP